MKAFPLAFPLVSKEPYQHDWGMDLRDYFAAKAMQSLIVNRALTTDTISKEAYRQADFMMKARIQK